MPPKKGKKLEKEIDDVDGLENNTCKVMKIKGNKIAVCRENNKLTFYDLSEEDEEP